MSTYNRPPGVTAFMGLDYSLVPDRTLVVLRFGKSNYAMIDDFPYAEPDPSKRKKHGPEVKGKRGKVKRW